VLGAKVCHCLRHHLARDRVDGWLADGDREAGLGDRADACTCLEDDTGTLGQEADGCHHECAVGDVRIVTGILDDAGHCMIAAEGFPGKRKARDLASGQGDLDRVGELAGEQGRQRSPGCGRGAGPGGPAATQRRGGLFQPDFVFASVHVAVPGRVLPVAVIECDWYGCNPW
jgi:hypothetical protein